MESLFNTLDIISTTVCVIAVGFTVLFLVFAALAVIADALRRWK